jgi:steroid delta-isomerase-like uncharacterized protein
MNDTSQSYPTALDVVTGYLAALAAGDSQAMDGYRAADYVLDLVQRDAFEQGALSHQETRAFWPSWFDSFPDMDLHVVRTIAAEEVVVTQWVFMGTNSGRLTNPVFEPEIEATGKTIRFRGVSVYDVQEGLIQRETLYLDLATLFVELGVRL